MQAYLLAIPAVSQAANRNEILKLGPANTTVPIFENRMDSKSVFLTPNTETPYSWMWLDLRGGPVVLEAPPKVLGALNDMWYRWVVDIGFTGPDKGAGGKFLILPPGYKGEIPEGYFVVKSPTFSLWAPWRSFVVNGDPKPGVDLVKKHTRVYRLSEAANPPAMKFVNVSGKDFGTVAPADYAFWELLNQVVQEEPSESLDPDPAGLLRLDRHREGQTLRAGCPDEEDPHRGGAGGRRHRARHRLPHARRRRRTIIRNSSWQLPFVGGYRFQTQPDVLNLDAYIFYYFMATGVTPAMEEKMVGQGSQYAWTAKDCERRTSRRRQELQASPAAQHPGQELLVGDHLRQPGPLDGADRPAVPERQQPDRRISWSMRTARWTSTSARRRRSRRPTGSRPCPARAGTRSCASTARLKPWFDKTWRPGEIELMQ